jgi:hypothetical protein
VLIPFQRNSSQVCRHGQRVSQLLKLGAFHRLEVIHLEDLTFGVLAGLVSNTTISLGTRSAK